MSVVSRAVKRRDISVDMLKNIEQNIESVPLTFHDKMTKILLDIDVEKLHRSHEFETVAIIARCASLSGIWPGAIADIQQCNVDQHFKNRWKIIKENPSATVVDFLGILGVTKSKLNFV
jgi:hypothetical protein